MGKPKHIVISKHDAVFWMDQRGRWHNRNGLFEHPKIIDYFNRSIRKDGNGYFLFQAHAEFTEKVYFRYEDTALFVFDVVAEKENLDLVLNTGQKMRLQPHQLIIEKDNLYVDTGNDLIKFSERALIQISKYIRIEGHQYFIKICAKELMIREKTEIKES